MVVCILFYTYEYEKENGVRAVLACVDASGPLAMAQDSAQKHYQTFTDRVLTLCQCVSYVL